MTHLHHLHQDSHPSYHPTMAPLAPPGYKVYRYTTVHGHLHSYENWKFNSWLVSPSWLYAILNMKSKGPSQKFNVKGISLQMLVGCCGHAVTPLVIQKNCGHFLVESAHHSFRFVSLHYIASLFLFGTMSCNSLSKYHVAPPPQPHQISHLTMNIYGLHWTWEVD